MELDRIDRSLLNELQKDCKQTHKELALKLGMSVTAIYERVRKLERAGVIHSYVALVDREKVDLGSTVFCHIRLVAHNQQAIRFFEKKIVELPEVIECHHVSGDYDYLLKIQVSDMSHYRKFMVEKLTTLDVIGNTQSSFTISEVRNTTAVSL